MIGVSLGLGVWPTIFLATTLAYIRGFTLGLVPVMRHQGKTFFEALKVDWGSDLNRGHGDRHERC
tara:strand:- start:292 stop:486 length:195 start_codon:yes stop_codon:yes gene_type:complete